jgi:hypothetical protein
MTSADILILLAPLCLLWAVLTVGFAVAEVAKCRRGQETDTLETIRRAISKTEGRP